METISTEFTVSLPWDLLYADNSVVTAGNKNEIIMKLNQ